METGFNTETANPEKIETNFKPENENIWNHIFWSYIFYYIIVYNK